MPFDALVAVPRQTQLSDALDAQNLNPVSLTTLAAHKVAQQQKFGPSFWFRHQAMVSITLVIMSPVVGALVGATQGFAPHSSAMTIAASFVWMCMVALITGTGLVRLRAGSHWEERRVSVTSLDSLGVPEPIARIARSLQSDVPDAKFILGELKRESAVLDPYLLIEHGKECACLGIWEDGHVVECAR
jgi:hypothetical protein